MCDERYSGTQYILQAHRWIHDINDNCEPNTLGWYLDLIGAHDNYRSVIIQAVKDGVTLGADEI